MPKLKILIPNLVLNNQLCSLIQKLTKLLLKENKVPRSKRMRPRPPRKKKKQVMRRNLLARRPRKRKKFLTGNMRRIQIILRRRKTKLLKTKKKLR